MLSKVPLFLQTGEGYSDEFPKSSRQTHPILDWEYN
ncbi:ubiquitin-conjugating enzyme 32, partial [Prunus dulcis]